MFFLESELYILLPLHTVDWSPATWSISDQNMATGSRRPSQVFLIHPCKMNVGEAAIVALLIIKIKKEKKRKRGLGTSFVTRAEIKQIV